MRMLLCCPVVAVVALFLAVPLAAVHAQSLSFETNAESNTSGGLQMDPQGPATSGTLLSAVTTSDGSALDFSGDAYARSAADDRGRAALAAEGIFANGQAALQILSAEATFTEGFTNTTTGDLPFTYSFVLPGPTLSIADFAGLEATDDPTITTEFDYELVLVNGALPPVTVFSSNAQLVGGRVNHTLTTGGDQPLGSFAFGSGGDFGYQFDPLIGGLSDSAAAGAEVTITAHLSVRAAAPGFEAGGSAVIGDPLDLSVGGYTSTLTIVPEPGSFGLAAALMAGLALFRGRRRP